VLASPANGASGVATSPTLTWNASTGATSYHLQLSTDSTFATTLVDQSALATTSYAAGGLAASTKYYWRVSASNGAGSSAYSGVFSFTTGATPTGLVAAYAFDEGTGTTVSDKSGNNLTGTIAGATWTTAGRYGNALSFNGTSSYVDLGNPSKLQITGSMTWSAWIKAAANPPDDGQIVAKSSGTSGWQLKTSPDTGPHTFGVGVSASSSRFIQRYSKTVRSLNIWYHVAGVYNATARTLDIYVNGVLDDGKLVGTVPAAQTNASVNVNIGRRSGGYYFNGIIDEVRIYSRALTQAEIQSDMNTPLGTAPLARASVDEDTRFVTQVSLPGEYSLDQNFPNPFNPETRISFGIPQTGRVKLEIFNVLGERTAVLVDEERQAGFYLERFNASGLPSGVYFLRFTAGEFRTVRKMVLTR
jgi:hypothetical protein